YISSSMVLLMFFCDVCLCIFSLFFFFSSRRRHTRSTRDWSSDVCSSDLHSLSHRGHWELGLAGWFVWKRVKESYDSGRDARLTRSEERRVGKECRCRGTRCRVRNK